MWGGAKAPGRIDPLIFLGGRCPRSKRVSNLVTIG